MPMKGANLGVSSDSAMLDVGSESRAGKRCLRRFCRSRGESSRKLGRGSEDAVAWLAWLEVGNGGARTHPLGINGQLMVHVMAPAKLTKLLASMGACYRPSPPARLRG